MLYASSLTGNPPLSLSRLSWAVSWSSPRSAGIRPFTPGRTGRHVTRIIISLTCQRNRLDTAWSVDRYCGNVRNTLQNNSLRRRSPSRNDFHNSIKLTSPIVGKQRPLWFALCWVVTYMSGTSFAAGRLTDLDPPYTVTRFPAFT
jgi:hypothetical protein